MSVVVYAAADVDRHGLFLEKFGEIVQSIGTQWSLWQILPLNVDGTEA
jgi:hypothetical protein